MKSMSKTDRRIYIVATVVFGVHLLFLCVSAWLGYLHTDAAKNALNIAYPHPPLSRWIMLASEWVFGKTIFAARLPSLLVGILSWFVFDRVAVLRRGSSSLARWMILILAGGGSMIVWMGQGNQTPFLVLGVALIAYGFTWKLSEMWHVTLSCIEKMFSRFPKMFSSIRWCCGFFGGSDAFVNAYIVLFGFLVALWSQLQAILLFPAVAIACIAYYLRTKNPWPGIFAIVHVFLFFGWFATNPWAVADALHLATGTGRTTSIWLDYLATVNFLSMAIFLTIVMIGIIASLFRGAMIRFSKIGFLGASVFLFAYTMYVPGDWYVPYIFALLSWGLIEFCESRRQAIVALFLAISISGFDILRFRSVLCTRSFAYGVPSSEVRDLARGFGSDETIMALGGFGYDFQYISDRRFLRFASDPVVQSSIRHVVVPFPKSLSEDERVFLRSFVEMKRVGQVVVYERK